MEILRTLKIQLSLQRIGSYFLKDRQDLTSVEKRTSPAFRFSFSSHLSCKEKKIKVEKDKDFCLVKLQTVNN